MEKVNKKHTWLGAGYDLFANEGPAGIQVERLARIVDLNKSSFYHYFGDVDGYLEELVQYHVQFANLYNEQLKKITTIDPDYIELVINYKLSVMFHMQLLQMPDSHPNHILAMKIDQEENVIIAKLWSRYLGVENNPDLAVRYLDIIRASFYGRINFNTLDFQFLHGLLVESKAVMNELTNRKNEMEENGSSY